VPALQLVPEQAATTSAPSDVTTSAMATAILQRMRLS
jgi:hypothetical protein